MIKKFATLYKTRWCCTLFRRTASASCPGTAASGAHYHGLLFKIRLNIILHASPGLSSNLSLSVLQANISYAFLASASVQCPTFDFTRYRNYMMNYVIIPNLVLLFLSLFQMFSAAPYSQTFSLLYTC